MKKTPIFLLSIIISCNFTFTACINDLSDSAQNLSDSDNFFDSSINSSILDIPQTNNRDIFTELKQYVIQKGVYDSSSKDYTLTLGYRYSSDNVKYTRKISYSLEYEDLRLLHYVEDDALTCLFSIYIDELNGVYEWNYINSYNEYLYGPLYASIFHPDYLLESSYDNLSSSSRRLTAREHASSLATLLILYFPTDFIEINVTILDLGFTNFVNS